MRGYSRRKVGGRRPHRLLVIVCEGTETEPTYFRRYRERGREPRILIPGTQKTDPVSLVKYARKQMREHGVDVSSGDRVWCVFDADQNDDRAIDDACKLARPGINIALSNPSFELWLLLHFAYDESRIDNIDVIRRLRKHIPDFTKTADVYDLLIGRRGEAVCRAKRLNEVHRARSVELLGTRSNPSTQVFVLVEEILAMGDRSERTPGA